jgi:hypothetical protein
MPFRITVLPARACRYSGTREAKNNRASETYAKTVACAIV